MRVLAACNDGRREEAEAARVPNGYEELLGLVTSMVPAVAAGAVAQVACGLPGTSDGKTALFMPALPWLEGRALAPDLSVRLGASVVLGNDGQFTLLAEAVEGAAAGAASAVLVAVGTGIGGAIMSGGRIWRGHHGSAGSWGWLPASGARSASGHGPFETMASGAALSAVAAALHAGWDGLELLGAARRGEPEALSAVRSYAAHLGSGIAAIASVVDPELVVIGGGVSAAMDVLGPMLARQMADLASPDGQKIPVRAAVLGPRAGVVGAMLAARPGARSWLE